MSEWGERSEEEREAARLERERRRGGRAPAAWEEIAEGHAAPGPASTPVIPDVPPAEPQNAEHPPVRDGGEESFHEAEVPSGTRRVPRSALSGSPGVRRSAPRPPRSGVRPGEVPGQGRRRPQARSSPGRAGGRGAAVAGAEAGRKRPHSRLVRVLSVVSLLVVLALLWFLFALFQPFHGDGHGSITVRVPAHSSAGQIGDELARDGVISSAFFFKLRATLAGDRGKLLSGTYHLKLGMGYGSVLTVLTTPPPPVPTTELTIAEGDTRRKIDALLRAQHIRGSYLAETRHSRLLDPRRYGAPASLPSLEGFLFPSTYQLRTPIRMGDLVAAQLRAFRQRFATIDFSYARAHHLTPFDVLTVASIVQGEAQTLHDMPLIASVIYNRLHFGMLLQMDSTTRYAVGNYTTPLTQSQLASPSPYNTRVHAGLPLGPINNPGLAAIQAAAHPAQTSFLYFVAKPCGDGASAFAVDNAQFQRLVQQYQTTRARLGGRSPTHC